MIVWYLLTLDRTMRFYNGIAADQARLKLFLHFICRSMAFWFDSFFTFQLQNGKYWYQSTHFIHYSSWEHKRASSTQWKDVLYVCGFILSHCSCSGDASNSKYGKNMFWYVPQSQQKFDVILLNFTSETPQCALWVSLYVPTLLLCTSVLTCCLN